MEFATRSSGSTSTAEMKIPRPTNALPLKSVQAIVKEYQGERLSCYLLFLWELGGGKGHGHVPKDLKARTAYYDEVRRYFKFHYGLTKLELSDLVGIYNSKQSGAIVRARTRLDMRIGEQIKRNEQ